MWRRNKATLRMLARCAGRLALAAELTQRDADQRRRYSHEGGIEQVLALWAEALATDGGGPAPRAHRLVLEEIGRREDEGLRDRYVETVAAVDLDASAVPTLVGWICDRVEAGEPMDVWVRALRGACGAGWAHREMPGAPALLRALCERPETEPLALALLTDQHHPPATTEAVLLHADRLEEILAEEAWRRRRSAKMTMDDPQDAGGNETKP